MGFDNAKFDIFGCNSDGQQFISMLNECELILRDILKMKRVVIIMWDKL